VAGFVVLNWAAWKSGRMSVPMLAHLINNLMSVM
jgi:membrane protease YdiL (CAAX protease family)